jgi:hypothetical protein
MPLPLYFHPFRDKKHSIGVGGIVLPSSISLHFVAPTLARKDFLYLWQLGRTSTTFANYMANTDRIYVMGHCSPGDTKLTTESGKLDGRQECTARELAEILCRHGLPGNSQAHIRIHACNSATPPAGSNFATEFADWMAFYNRYNVTIRGYDVAVGMYVFARLTDTLGSANKHAIDYHPPQPPPPNPT